MPTVSLIIATYNWPGALKKSIESAWKQTVLPNEIIIADDGSGEETAALIRDMAVISTIPIIHIWHPDNGFRLSEIRNKAIQAAQYDYIIQIDGDIILEEHFVQDHLAIAVQGSFICGSRVKLSATTSQALLEDKIIRIKRTGSLFSHLLNSVRLPLLGHILADQYKKHQPTALRGCNMSFWRKDLLAINGYNNALQGWGHEDAELAIRLINNGIKKRHLKFMGIAFHIYHPEHDRTNELKNKRMLEIAIQQNATWVTNGIKDTLLDEKRN